VIEWAREREKEGVGGRRREQVGGGGRRREEEGGGGKGGANPGRFCGMTSQWLLRGIETCPRTVYKLLQVYDLVRRHGDL